jgi:hypothetical protein
MTSTIVGLELDRDHPAGDAACGREAMYAGNGALQAKLVQGVRHGEGIQAAQAIRVIIDSGHVRPS